VLQQFKVRTQVALVVVFGFILVIAAGCGNRGTQNFAGGSGPTPTPAPTSSPTPSPSPTPVPGGLSAAPASLSFGNLAVNTTSTQAVKVTNTGSAAISITKDTISGAGFSTGLTTPLTLNGGQSANVQIAFSPTASGSVTGSLVLSTNTTASLTVPLSGNGITPQAHSVDVSWNASTTSNLRGYNVYRGTTTGGPYTKISSTLSPTTLAFTDLAPVSGASYYYIVTAVDGTGVESTPSNEVHVVIPTP
jgi:Abnormal spindle-like microcephaly-assoc'd, ASPM-SPD-2-Hydin